MFDLLKDTQNSPFTLIQCFTKPGKAVSGSNAQNEQANLQPTFNKGEGGASLVIFFTDCRYL